MIINNDFNDYTNDDRSESREALNNLKKKKALLLPALIIIGIIINIIILNLYTTNSISLLIGIILCFVGNGLLYDSYIRSIKPYQKILEDAQHNDQIRKDERIRMKERERLSQNAEHLSEQDIIKSNLNNVKLDTEIAKEIEKIKKMEKK